MAIPVTVENEVLIGKSSRSEVCGMEMNASVVKAVTSTLYDYKKEAVVREYATNITDSHNDSGKEGLKGYIHIPTKMNPNIEFHDKGLGMTEDTIYSVYTVLGKSTKRGDNTTNGSLGFGSKAYGTVCDQMTVISTKDGVKVVVVCYKDRTGMLSADTKSISTTDEPNGTIVKIPVKMNEVSQWQETAAIVLGAFKVPHEVNSFGEYQSLYEGVLSLCESVRKDDTVFLQKHNNITNNLRSSKYVLMGDVLYSLPDFSSLVPNLKIKDTLKSITNSGFYVTHFNIGELDHAPSRESISYDDQTFLKVKHRVTKDTLKGLRDFQSKVGDLDTMSYYKFRKEFGGSEVYTAMADFRLPFLKGYTLKQICPLFQGERWCREVMFLSNKDVYGAVKGYVPSADKTYSVFSNTVSTLNQKRLFSIKDPLILYSEKEKGLYKLKNTVENAVKVSNGNSVLVVENKEKALALLNWFGEGVIERGDKYSPEKTIKAKTSRNVRGGYGVKEDWETLGQVYTVNEKGYSFAFKKVDLLGEGVYFCEGDYIEVKGVVKGVTTKLSFSHTLARLLHKLGVKKVVVVNKNNKGKISRSGVNNVTSVIKTAVRENKKVIVKAKVWDKDLRVISAHDTPLSSKIKSVQKVEDKKLQSYNEMAETICNVSDFGLKSTPLYKLETSRKVKLLDKVEEELSTLKSKLPLWSLVSTTKNKSDIEHYLRLEKIIK